MGEAGVPEPVALRILSPASERRRQPWPQPARPPCHSRSRPGRTSCRLELLNSISTSWEASIQQGPGSSAPSFTPPDHPFPQLRHLTHAGASPHLTGTALGGFADLCLSKHNCVLPLRHQNAFYATAGSGRPRRTRRRVRGAEGSPGPPGAAARGAGPNSCPVTNPADRKTTAPAPAGQHPHQSLPNTARGPRDADSTPRFNSCSMV